MLLPLPEAFDIRVASRGHHHEAARGVFEHQHPQRPGVVPENLKIHLGEELVVEDT